MRRTIDLLAEIFFGLCVLAIDVARPRTFRSDLRGEEVADREWRGVAA